MNYRLQIGLLALMATVIGSSLSSLASANGRAVVAGRQQVQAAVAVAMADGALSRWEMASILRKGSRVLTPGELQTLQRTLDGLYSGNNSSVEYAVTTYYDSHRSEQEAASHPKHADTRTIVAAKEVPTETVSYQQAAKADEGANPFKEEEEAGMDVDLATPLVESEDVPGGCEMLDGCSNAVYGASCSGPELADGLVDVFAGSCTSCMTELPDIRFVTAVDAFKGPVDLDNLNGNFGVRFAANAGLPLVSHWDLGVQVGTSGVISDFHGSQFTDSTVRSQNFTTVGLFQRAPFGQRRLKYGFAFDWLYDRYYWSFRMSQWRVKLAYEWSPCTEIGMLACIPNDGDTAQLRHGTDLVTLERFKPVAQGSLYYRRCWSRGAETTAWLGIAEEPGQYLFGGDARVPLNSRWSMVGNVNYVLPSASGVGGQDEEMWNVSLGIELKLGGGNHCMENQFTPMFRLADNGTFAVRRY
ncbi:MAG: hypothetical protein JXB62_07950 [Pirellulales bacterium]|nr:hypothetical protein [Pirellulales bacterium]